MKIKAKIKENVLLMQDDYLITILGTMEQGDESDSIELTTRGDYSFKNNKYYITYEESSATGFLGCTTTVKVEGNNKVSMLRFGARPSQLIIEKGRRHVAHYDTGEGSLSLGVAADEIISELKDDGGTVRFSYMLDMNSEAISRNIVEITVKPRKN